MKRVIIALLLLLSLGLTMANPIEYKLIGKLWFSEQDELKLQFRQMLCGQDDRVVTISNGTNVRIEIVNFSQQEPPIVTIPSGFFNREAGYLSVSVGDLPTEEISWGTALDKDFCPLEGTQTATQLLISHPENSYYLFAKDYNPTCGTEFNTTARSSVNIHVRNQFGNPVPYYPINLQYMYPPDIYTDAQGNASFEYYCSKLRIILLYPNSWITECDTTFFAEPDQTYNIDFQITASSSIDPVCPPTGGSLVTYPSVLRSADNVTVHLVYNGKIDSSAQVELYDLKGRLLLSKEQHGNEMLLQLPGLNSGVYFLRLTSGGINLGSSKLIILK